MTFTWGGRGLRSGVGLRWRVVETVSSIITSLKIYFYNLNICTGAAVIFLAAIGSLQGWAHHQNPCFHQDRILALGTPLSFLKLPKFKERTELQKLQNLWFEVQFVVIVGALRCIPKSEELMRAGWSKCKTARLVSWTSPLFNWFKEWVSLLISLKNA